MFLIGKLILLIIILLSGLVFHLKNDQLVSLNYYVNTVELPLSLVVILILCVGALLGFLASLPIIIKLKRQQHKLQKQIKKSATGSSTELVLTKD